MAEALDIFRALADSTRLRILALLRRMELSVGELAQVLDQSQPRVSRHVKILADARLVERRKEGSWVFVALGQPERVEPLLLALDRWGEGNADAEALADAERLDAVRQDRTSAAAQWFEAHAGEWDAIRSLHVAESEIEAAMQEAIGDAPIGRLVDIGTGTGRMLELFAPQAESAIGIDRSSEMLRLARAKLSEQGLTHAELRQADFYALPILGETADAVIFHHVLHFAQQPEMAIGEAARVLGAGGRLVIVDFAPHDREELRTSDAHARLGFSDEQMLGWFKAANLSPVRTEMLGGGELTVKLWLARKAGEPGIKRKAA
ncbi:ArsR/SmtB family transcription factor [Stakelama marina]|uniref:Metalloregulator ArsR/SmtB family transcription factor n=1 Tax=Stakelama marina TaxID=2826939 RepID=A0A8T4IML2_9SPHN|nr:metalloregulator ArsR/SmtB family transcription factor [Stakelama marina]MBR0553386.1 metalloregulator ArsR/SmtB family transcription factor [Stakelama marina]